MLVRSIEKFLRQHHMPATKFGRLATQDPRLVHDLRLGRVPRDRTEERIRGFIAGFEAGQHAAHEVAIASTDTEIEGGNHVH